VTNLFYLIYIAFAGFILWPAVVHFGELIPGAQVSDLWNALWSIDFVISAIKNGSSLSCTELLNFPVGGCLWPSDVLGAAIVFPFHWFLSLTQAYTVLVLIQLSIIGIATDRLYRLLNKKGTQLQAMLSGLVMMSSSVSMTAVHNGSSEALSLGWAILAMGGIVTFSKGSKKGLVWLVLGSFSSWYGVLGVLIFGIGYLISLPNQSKKPVVVSMVIWMLLLLPYAFFVHMMSTGEDNLLLIKGAEELMQVRRTIGAADPLTYIAPLDYRSPDFDTISRYGEQFVHSAYLGWVVLLAALIQRKRSFLWGVFAVGLVLSLGPVLLYKGEPLVWNLERGFPLPYLVLEALPGFSGLTLLYRLAFIPMLCLCLLFPIARSKMQVVILLLFIVLELKFISPVHDLPNFAQVPSSETMKVLQEEPEGGVGHYPIVGGRETLYLQTIHKKPIAGTLNFAWSNRMDKIFRAAIKAGENDSELIRRTTNTAKQTGIRYIILDLDQSIMPDHYSNVANKLQHHFPTVGVPQNDYIVLRLW
jgi:hypothetical protein